MAVISSGQQRGGARSSSSKGLMYSGRIAFVLVLMGLYFWREEAVIDTVRIASGTEGLVLPRYTCSANIQDYLIKFETVCNDDTKVMPKPIWIPGFPGSGSDLFLSIVETLTGLSTDPKKLENNPPPPAHCKDYIPTRKTDCPLSFNCPKPVNKKAISDGKVIKYHESAIMLVRNPQFAIPSYLNEQWEQQENLSSSRPKKQAPESWWNKQRNPRFKDLLSQWERSIIQWTSEEADIFPSVSLVVAYERLTSPHYGPHLIERLANELRRADSPVLVAPPSGTRSQNEIYFCLWENLVSKTNKASKTSLKRKRTYEPGYTKEQQKELINMVDHVIHEELDTNPKDPQQHGHRSDLLGILTDFQRELKNSNV